MINRRRLAMSTLNEDEFPLTITSFPRLGTIGEFTRPYSEPGGPYSESLFVPDTIINPHARFPYAFFKISS